VFPVRYELSFHILFRRNSIINGDKAKILRCFNLAMVKLTTVHVTKLPL
jgi:hypothetical protein